VTLTEPGRYTVAYRVVSSDGHPIQGRTAFVLDVPAPTPSASPTSATPSPTATPTATSTGAAATETASPDASPVSSTEQDGGSPLPWILGGVAVVALVGGTVLVARSRST
jgi:hypothetical protein